MFDKKEWNKRYYRSHREQALESSRKHSKQWQKNNKERCNRASERWRRNNREYVKQWQKKNKGKVKEYSRRYYENNKDKVWAAYRKRYAEIGPTLQMLIRTSYRYRLWQSDVFTRDGFTCQDCGRRGCLLHAHHEEAFSDILELNDIKTYEQAMDCSELWNINNGITLCVKCHKIRHSRIYSVQRKSNLKRSLKRSLEMPMMIATKQSRG